MQGKGVSDGIAIGVLRFFKRAAAPVVKAAVEDPEAELARFAAAVALAAEQLDELAETARHTLGDGNALLFEIHKIMLQDIDYINAVTRIIRDDKVCSEYAVDMAAKQFAAMLSAMDNDYMKGRAADVHDVSQRVIAILTGSQKEPSLPSEPAILAAEDFAPSETAQFGCGQVLGLATAGGTANSHTAIFARTMGIPAVISLSLNTSISNRSSAELPNTPCSAGGVSCKIRLPEIPQLYTLTSAGYCLYNFRARGVLQTPICVMESPKKAISLTGCPRTSTRSIP